jgi:hypothetical protein
MIFDEIAVDKFKRELSEGVSAFSAGDLAGYRDYVKSTSIILGDMCDSGQVNTALALEPLWYQSLVKKIESENHYAEAFSNHAKSLWSAGRSLSPGEITTGNSKIIAFVAQNSVLLGHTEVMLLVMEGWRFRFPDVRVIFIGLSPCQPKLAQRLSSIGVEAKTPKANLTPLGLARWLRDIVVNEDVGTAVWLSLPTWVPFLFGYRVARRQVFWSLKFHPVHLGEEITHIGMTKEREGVVQINGKPWLAFQPSLAVAITERSEATRAKIRGAYNEKFLFATLARTEKFNSTRFAVAVAEILKRCPESFYFFTGRDVSPVLERVFREYNVSSQAKFVGWVDTDLYANLIDCFLESFPFGCGVTGMQALSHGTPIVSMWDEDTLPTFYFKNLEDGMDFHQNWRISSTEAEYVDAAVESFCFWKKHGLRTKLPKNFIASLERGKYERIFELITGSP